jgi:hypothetical protein
VPATHERTESVGARTYRRRHRLACVPTCLLLSDAAYAAQVQLAPRSPWSATSDGYARRSGQRVSPGTTSTIVRLQYPAAISKRRCSIRVRNVGGSSGPGPRSYLVRHLTQRGAHSALCRPVRCRNALAITDKWAGTQNGCSVVLSARRCESRFATSRPSVSDVRHRGACGTDSFGNPGQPEPFNLYDTEQTHRCVAMDSTYRRLAGHSHRRHARFGGYSALRAGFILLDAALRRGRDRDGRFSAGLQKFHCIGCHTDHSAELRPT